MKAPVQERFDKDYQFLRHELIAGRMKVGEVKFLMRQRLAKVQEQERMDWHKLDPVRWRTGAGRDTEGIMDDESEEEKDE